MEELSQLIQTIIVIVIAGSFLAFFSVSAFYRGKNMKQFLEIGKIVGSCMWIIP